MADSNVIPFPTADPIAMEAFLHRCGQPAPATGDPCVLQQRHELPHETVQGLTWPEVPANG